MKLTKEQFEADYAKENQITVSDLSRHGLVTVPCNCGLPLCKGWQRIHKSLLTENEKSN